MALDSSDSLASMKALEGAPGIRGAAVFGGGLHVTVIDPVEAEHTIRQSLQSKGISIGGLEAIEPSMEDVFVEMIEREERSAREAAG